MESVIAKGDLAKLTPDERVRLLQRGLQIAGAQSR